MQLLLQPDNTSEGQVFRLQVTDAPEVFSTVTTPKPVSLPLSYDGAELILDFVDFAGDVTLYRRVNITGVVWVNGTSVEIAGGVGVVEVYHR